MPALRIPQSAKAGSRLKQKITYHGRSGHPIVHRAKTGRAYIMVRKKGGGTKRLYSGTSYSEKRTRR